MRLIFFTELNIRGAWVVYGRIGIRQYYGYTREQAKKAYKGECLKRWTLLWVIIMKLKNVGFVVG